MSNTRINCLLVCLFVFFAISKTELFAQSPGGRPLSQQKHHQLKSAINGSSYQIHVSLPKNYSSNDTTRYPTLYLLDGNSFFPVAHAMRQLLDLSGEIRDIIIVGIGYEWTTSYQPWFVGRWTDLTHTSVPATDTNKNILNMADLPKGRLLSGGGEKFYSVIKHEVVPFIEKNYRTNSDRAISGHSLGGLFTANILLSQDRFFTRFGINSPSVWWDNSKLLATEKALSEKTKTLPAQVFISVGALEGQMMVGGMNNLNDALKSHNYQGLAMTSQVFESETHTSVVAVSVTRLLKVFYEQR